MYKSNNEHPKNRMFAYNLSIILTGLLIFMSNFCATLFTFTLFAMAFGGLLGNWFFITGSRDYSFCFLNLTFL